MHRDKPNASGSNSNQAFAQPNLQTSLAEIVNVLPAALLVAPLQLSPTRHDIPHHHDPHWDIPHHHPRSLVPPQPRPCVVASVASTHPSRTTLASWCLRTCAHAPAATRPRPPRSAHPAVLHRYSCTLQCRSAACLPAPAPTIAASVLPSSTLRHTTVPTSPLSLYHPPAPGLNSSHCAAPLPHTPPTPLRCTTAPAPTAPHRATQLLPFTAAPTDTVDTPPLLGSPYHRTTIPPYC